MKTIAILGLTVALSGLPSTEVSASTLADICHTRAEAGSGYSGARSGLNWQIGKVRLRLSGSAAFGISHSKGTRPSVVSGFSGRDMSEQRAKRKYKRIYDACISAG